MERSSGILLPISALPSPYGIGTLGKAAYAFVDELVRAEQRWWQILPVGPTSYGDSPYQSFSTFAGNPYFIDLETLCEEGLLEKAEIEAVDWGSDPAKVDYEKIYNGRFVLLEKAKQRGWEKAAEEIRAFAEENKSWLPDYALYMALKRHFGMKAWTQWEDADIRLREKGAVEAYREKLADEIELFIYIQYLFFKQWDALRTYAKEQNIGIIGDMPIYVAMDSADVWAEPHWFQLDEKNVPYEVAGVPPDYFTADGQLWGNPLYDWDAMKQDGYGWWVRRIAGAEKLYDVIRIDHFRGLESYWAVPYGDTHARNGHWVKGPGMELISVLKENFPQVAFIAEDLGYLTEEVKQLLKDSGFPGMKVLEFAFDSREPSDYLPHTYTPHCVCYVGTHDNETVMAWKDAAAPEDIAMARTYLGLNEEEGFHWGIIRGGMGSVAELFVTQMQDFLALGAEARMNVPSKLGGNWQWRLKEGQITKDLIERIADMTRLYGRSRKKWQA
ncbi:MAG: 4-alpha-glucanotransferase [Bacillota bacterium]|nr:4-alpha-glucanotransferase [Bacillota bacterium]